MRSGVSYLDKVANAIRQRVPVSALPDEDPVDLFRIYAVLAMTTGGDVSERDVHHAWVAWMLARDPQHPALVPFEDLDTETVSADKPYAEAINEVAKTLASSPNSI